MADQKLYFYDGNLHIEPPEGRNIIESFLNRELSNSSKPYFTQTLMPFFEVEENLPCLPMVEEEKWVKEDLTFHQNLLTHQQRKIMKLNFKVAIRESDLPCTCTSTEQHLKNNKPITLKSIQDAKKVIQDKLYEPVSVLLQQRIIDEMYGRLIDTNDSVDAMKYALAKAGVSIPGVGIESPFSTFDRSFQYHHRKPVHISEPEKKALKLLSSIIGDKETGVYDNTGRLFVKGKIHNYIVRRSGFLHVIENKGMTKKVRKLCIGIDSRYDCPPTDRVVALKLMLENHEEEVIKEANFIGEYNINSLEEIPKAACM